MLDAVSQMNEDQLKDLDFDTLSKHAIALTRAAAYKRKVDIKNKDILENGADEKAVSRAHDAAFDERITVVGLMIEGLIPMMRENTEVFESLKKLFGYVKETKADDNIISKLTEFDEALQKEYEQRLAGGVLDLEGKREYKYAMAFVEELVQALRIDVNNEFEVLYEFMEKLPECIKPGGRAAILTFHSGEDRLVKKALKSGYKAGIYSDYAKDVIRPSAKECAQNGRARSTKMRWAIKK